MDQAVTRARKLSVVGAPEEVQRWVDAFVESALDGHGDWPHQHIELPTTQTSLGRLWSAIQKDFASVTGQPWSVVSRGFPPLPGSPLPPLPDDERPRDSSYHNLLHSLFGDFH
jgi:hypothetical protein